MPRKPKTNRDDVLTTALKLVDDLGLDALSMRRLADEIGVEAMSLYRYVPNKKAVLDGLHEIVLRKMTVFEPTEDWRADIRAMARSFRHVLQTHPNTIPLFFSRPALTPGSLDYVELGLRILEPPLPDLSKRLHAFQALFSFVLGHAALTHAIDAEPHESVDYAALPPERFFNLSKVAHVLVQSSHEDDFDYGVEAFIRGLATIEVIS